MIVINNHFQVRIAISMRFDIFMVDQIKCWKNLQKKYGDFQKSAVNIFISLSVECQRKKKRMTVKGCVIRPILSRDYCSREQVDLIDMLSMPYGAFKFILNDQDHLTKFCILRPLPDKRAACVAYHLMDIFLNFGGPGILQSDNGSEFTAEIETELMLLMVRSSDYAWETTASTKQGFYKVCDIKDLLIAWLEVVQFQKNNSHHSGIKCSPFAALFGSDAKIGLSSTDFLQEIIERLQTEDDLVAAIESSSNVFCTPD